MSVDRSQTDHPSTLAKFVWYFGALALACSMTCFSEESRRHMLAIIGDGAFVSIAALILVMGLLEWLHSHHIADLVVEVRHEVDTFATRLKDIVRNFRQDYAAEVGHGPTMDGAGHDADDPAGTGSVPPLRVAPAGRWAVVVGWINRRRLPALAAPFLLVGGISKTFMEISEARETVETAKNEAVAARDGADQSRIAADDSRKHADDAAGQADVAASLAEVSRKAAADAAKEAASGRAAASKSAVASYTAAGHSVDAANAAAKAAHSEGAVETLREITGKMATEAAQAKTEAAQASVLASKEVDDAKTAAAESLAEFQRNLADFQKTERDRDDESDRAQKAFAAEVATLRQQMAEMRVALADMRTRIRAESVTDAGALDASVDSSSEGAAP